jgi:hypothetical protein
VWSLGWQQAFRFVVMSDVDRLSVAQHIDLRVGGRQRFVVASSASRQR